MTVESSNCPADADPKDPASDPFYRPIVIDPDRGRDAAKWSFLSFLIQCLGAVCIVTMLMFIVAARRQHAHSREEQARNEAYWRMMAEDNRRKIDAISRAVKAEGIDPGIGAGSPD